jgi:UDP-glucose 4-epimerase
MVELSGAQRFAGRRILITGGLGFIGSNLAIRLVEFGAKVTLIDSLIPAYGGNLFNVAPVRDRVTVNVSDIRDVHGLRHLIQGQEILFNLAGQTSHLDSMADPVTDLEINCKAQLTLLEACRSENPTLRIVFASTRQVYGKPDALPVRETNPLRPVDVNGINKLSGEFYHLLYQQVYGLPTVILRLTNTYGPRMHVRDARHGFLGWWVRQIVEDQQLLVYGDGSQLRDFNYIDDCVDAFLVAAVSDAAVGGVFNLGASPQWSLADTAALLCRLNGTGSYRMVPFPPEARRIDVGDYFADASKIAATLGWRPRVALDEGFGRTLDYYRRYGRKHYWSDP